MEQNIDYSTAAIEIVKIYFDEWKYRHESFWKRLLYFIIITFFTTSMPITYSLFENLMLPNIPLIFFPFCGIILALLSYWISLAEYYRLAAVSGTIDSIIKKQLGKAFLKQELHDSIVSKQMKAKIGIWFPTILTVMQIVFAVLVIWIVTTNRL